MVMTRAMSRRTTRTRAVSCNWPLAFWKRRLNCSFLSLSASSLSWSSVMTRRSERRLLVFIVPRPLFRDALDEARLDRQLGRSEAERLARQALRHAVDLEHDAARRNARDPKFRGALALAHAHFDRLLRHRNVGKDPDPDAAGAFHVPRQRPPGGLDLTRGDALGLHRLEPELAEIERVSRLRIAVNAALEGLAELGSLWLHHDRELSPVRSIRPLRERARAVRGADD